MAEAYREAIAIYESLADDRPNEEGPLLEAYNARQSFAFRHDTKVEIDESLSLLEKNRRQLEAYRAAGHDSVEVRLSLVVTLRSLGHYYQTRGDTEEAIRCWRAGCQQGTGLDIAAPNDPRAWEYPTVCALELPRGDPTALTPAQTILRLEKAMQLLEMQYARDPDNSWGWLADVARLLADCYSDFGDPDNALRMERRVAELLPPRLDGNPFLELTRLHGMACVAKRERQVGQKEAARRHAKEAADGFETFCRIHAADASLLDAAVDFHPRLAPPLRHAEAVDQSRRVVECVLRIVRQRTGTNPDATQLRRLGELCVQMAKCRMRDDRDGVEADLREAVDAARRLVAMRPEYRYLLDDRLSRLARWLAELGRRPQAAACLHECEHLWGQDADGLRGVARNFRNLANKMNPQGKVLSNEEKAERERYLAEAARLEKAADEAKARLEAD
jgi:tetratricopeptide (TPR) repeat protein